MKLVSEERGDLWKDYGETHPQKRPKPSVKVAGYGKCPVAGSQAALPCPESRLGYSLHPHPRDLPAPHGLSQAQWEVTGYGQEISTKSKSCGTAWQVINLDTDAVALSSVCREVRTVVKPGHALHHSCAQEDMQTWWTNLPHPPSQFAHAWSEGRPWGILKSPLNAYTKDFNKKHVTLQLRFHSEVHEEEL